MKYKNDAADDYKAALEWHAQNGLTGISEPFPGPSLTEAMHPDTKLYSVQVQTWLFMRRPNDERVLCMPGQGRLGPEDGHHIFQSEDEMKSSIRTDMADAVHVFHEVEA